MVQKTSKSAEVAVSEACEPVDQEREEIRERFWRAVEQIRKRNADKDPDEVLREVTEVVEEVRQEQYERARRTRGDPRLGTLQIVTAAQFLAVLEDSDVNN